MVAHGLNPASNIVFVSEFTHQTRIPAPGLSMQISSQTKGRAQ
jgi:hypothetical protein